MRAGSASGGSLGGSTPPGERSPADLVDGSRAQPPDQAGKPVLAADLRVPAELIAGIRHAGRVGEQNPPRRRLAPAGSGPPCARHSPPVPSGAVQQHVRAVDAGVDRTDGGQQRRQVLSGRPLIRAEVALVLPANEVPKESSNRLEERTIRGAPAASSRIWRNPSVTSAGMSPARDKAPLPGSRSASLHDPCTSGWRSGPGHSSGRTAGRRRLR